MTKTEAQPSSLMPDAVSVPYPYSRTLDGNGASHLSACAGNGIGIDRFCKKHNFNADSYIRGALLCALQRIIRQDGLVLFCNPSCDEKQTILPLVGSMGWMELSADEVLKLADVQFAKSYPAEFASGHKAEVHLLYTPSLSAVAGEAEPEADLIHFSSEKAEDGSYTLSLAYNPELYSRRDMQALLDAWYMLATEFCQRDCPVNRLPIVTPEERDRLLALGTGETLDYDKSKTFIDLFREQVAKTPDAVAVVDKNSQLTYRELDEASDEYAKTVTPGTFVCLEMPRVKEFVVAVLGIWKAGSAYVPIDTEYPEERKRFMREECDGKPLPSPDIAYMIYTSGSTGKPKGVMVQHKSLISLVLWHNSKFAEGAGTRHIVHSSFSFDASLVELICPLGAGGEVHILNEQMRYDVPGMVKYMHDKQITAMDVSTQLGAELILNYDLPLEHIILAGEKMPVMDRKGLKLFNGYGPTEFTVCSAYYEVSD
ncbi:MAG: AMP-binding protein, partial [Bacteroidales bacterium]|nr:AMP-binding protein [Bacteroidales bacterium]